MGFKWKSGTRCIDLNNDTLKYPLQLLQNIERGNKKNIQGVLEHGA